MKTAHGPLTASTPKTLFQFFLLFSANHQDHPAKPSLSQIAFLKISSKETVNFVPQHGTRLFLKLWRACAKECNSHGLTFFHPKFCLRGQIFHSNCKVGCIGMFYIFLTFGKTWFWQFLIARVRKEVTFDGIYSVCRDPQ